jgi:hypothetical protein
MPAAAADLHLRLGWGRPPLQSEERDTLSVSELYTVANDMHLKVPDMGKMIEKLNDAGG